VCCTRVKTSHYKTVGSSTAKEHFPDNSYVLEGTDLRGSLSVCSWYQKDRLDVRAGVKFTPEPESANDIVAPWEDAPYPPDDLPDHTYGYQESTMHWYQQAPKVVPVTPTARDTGRNIYLVVPRVFQVPCVISSGVPPQPDSAEAGRLPDDCLAAEGPSFRFCVTTGEEGAPKEGDPCPPRPRTSPSEPTGTATFSAADEFSPGIPQVYEHCYPQTHHWEGTVSGLIAPDTESDPLEPLSGEFQLDAHMLCEQLDSGTGAVDGLMITADGLGFEFLDSLAFARVASEVTVDVFGICTTEGGPYLCEISLAGDWVPRRLSEADITSGAFVVNYDSDVDTWED
jgi:hypothetical protein